MNQMSQAPGREQAGVLQAGYGPYDFCLLGTVHSRSGEPCFGLIVCWVFASMPNGTKNSTGNTQSTGFYGGTRNLEKQTHFKSVDHQKQRLEFTRNFLRFAQAHLSLKLLRLKKSFDLTCSRVVSV